MAREHTRTKDAARQVFVAMNPRNFDLFEALIKDDVAFVFPGTGKAEGRRRSLLLLKHILRKTPKLCFSVEDKICFLSDYFKDNSFTR